MSVLKIKKNSFEIDGKKVRILSGALHYFRVHPKLWADRLRKLRLMGLNTVETYVAWNLHEPKPGKFNFKGQLDVRKFCELAQKEGLHVLFRPGPYICAEWEFGGFPWWLMCDPTLRLRCMNKPYLTAVKRYLSAVIKQVLPLMSDRGGPIMAVQVENEYGSYGNDTEYMQWTADTLQKLGVKVPLFTSDGSCDWRLIGGTVKNIYKTVNFGSGADGHFKNLKKFQSDKPLMCMEFWNGWFDHWEEKHHTRTPEDAAASLSEILEKGDSVNFYMFHGGTNYGYNSGANCNPGKYEPTIGSYDYDSPLDEAGDITPKYMAFREVLGKYTELPQEELPAPTPKKAYGKVKLTEMADMLDSLNLLSKPIKSATPEPMEYFGQGHGFILYRTTLQGPLKDAPLSIKGLADRAHVFQDGKLKGVLYRNDGDDANVKLDIPAGGARVEILVENMGRANYGPLMSELKGITGGVFLHGQQFVFNWEVFCLPLTSLKNLKFKKSAAKKHPRPAFLRGTLDIKDKPVDTYLNMEGWGRGMCWLNGFNLGRHWKVGPQMTHFIPAQYLKKGKNEIVVLELDEVRGQDAVFIDHAVLDIK